MTQHVSLFVRAIATMLIAALTAPSATAVIEVSSPIVGRLIRNHDGFALWHQAGGDIVVADSITFPRQEVRSYAIFDLNGIEPGSVSSGNFRMNMPVDFFWSNSNDTNAEVVAMYDIGTNLDALTGLTTAPFGVSNPIGIPIHNDLGSGAFYGSIAVGPANFNTTVSIPLSAQAIADINAAAGTAMGFGVNGETGRLQGNRFNTPRLSVFTFGEPVGAAGGVDFQLDEGEVSGDGTVNLTPRGADHHLNAHALDQFMLDEKFSEVRRRFRFSASTSDPVPIILSGDLEGTLLAAQGAASVNAMLQIFDTTNGQLVDETMFSELIAASIVDGQITLRIDELLMLRAELIPGRTYELISKISLSASITNPLGRADALFDNTFAVQLEAVPEPSGLVLVFGLLLSWSVSRNRLLSRNIELNR
jgi:hypothetical protein